MATLARDPLFARTPQRPVPQQPPPFANLLQTTLAPSGQAPFRMVDGPVPVRARWVQQPMAGVNLLTSTLAAAAAQAPFKVALPGVVQAPRRVQSPIEANRLPLLSVVVQAPFQPMDGPVPKRVAFRPQDTSQSGILVELIPMIRQSDWPNPVRRLLVQQPAPQHNLLTTTLAPVIVVQPFKQQTFTGPVPRIVPQPPQVWPNLLTTTLYVPPVIPPEPPPPEVTPAGRKRYRYYVEIDEQKFSVESLDHAQAILDRAKTLAVEAAREQAQAVVARRAPAAVIKRVKLKKPVIRTDAPINLQPYHRDIAQIYNEAARNAELYLLMQRRISEDDEDDALLLV